MSKNDSKSQETPSNSKRKLIRKKKRIVENISLEGNQNKPQKVVRKIKKTPKIKKHFRKSNTYKILKIIFKAVLFISLFCAIIGGIIVAILNSPFFNIKSIEVIGLKHYKYSDIIDITNIYKDRNWAKTINYNFSDLIRFKSTKNEEDIKKNRKYVKDVKINFSLSGKVIINVVERVPYVKLTYGSENIIIDKDLYVLELTKDSNPGIISVLGLKYDNYTEGKMIILKNNNYFDAVTKLISMVNDLDNDSQNKLMQFVKFIDASDILNLKVGLDDRINVSLGSYLELEEYKIKLLKEIYFAKLFADEKGNLNLTAENPAFMPS